MYKTSEEVAATVLLKLAGEVSPGVIRRLYRALFGHGHEDELLKAKLGLGGGAAAPDAAAAAAAKAEEVTPVIAVGGAKPGPTVSVEGAAADKAKDKGMGTLGILGMAGLGAGGGYLMANSKAPQDQPI